MVTPMYKPTSEPRPIGDAWLATLDGPVRLAAFYQLPLPMQRGAWAALRLQIEREREVAA